MDCKPLLIEPSSDSFIYLVTADQIRVVVHRHESIHVNKLKVEAF
jgi:hypothetical protein